MSAKWNKIQKILQRTPRMRAKGIEGDYVLGNIYTFGNAFGYKRIVLLIIRY